MRIHNNACLTETPPFLTFADAHHIEEEIPLVLVLIADAAQLRMRLERAPVGRVADPDWIRIQSGQSIRIQEGKNDPQK